MLTGLEKQFFVSAYNGLVLEDMKLATLFKQNNNLYNNNDNGIGCLYEKTMLYVILKQLLRDEFPLALAWGYPYPNDSTKIADLVVLEENRTLNSLVEFRRLDNDNHQDIIKDINKLRSNIDDVGKYIFIIQLHGGDIKEMTKYFVHNHQLTLVDIATFSSRFYDAENKGLYNEPINLYLFRV